MDYIMKKRYYAAYGSNLNIGQMRMRCPGARVIGTSLIPNYDLLFKGSRTGAYLTIEEKEGAEVPVGIWEVDERNEAALDRYEGFPQFYYKREISIPVKEIGSGRVRDRMIFVYIMHEDRALGIPTEGYLHICRQGYEDFKFDGRMLQKAVRRSGRGI